jgi:hypothetical protein
LHAHRLAQRSRKVLAYVVGADRQFTVAAIDQHCQLYGARSTDIAERVEGGPHRPTGEQDVIDENNRRTVDPARRQFGAFQGPRRPQP